MTPLRPTSASLSVAPDSGLDEPSMVSARIAEINKKLGAAKSKLRLAKAELLVTTKWNAALATVIFANDRVRGTGSEWVKGDANRGGRIGVTYQIASDRGVMPRVINSHEAKGPVLNWPLSLSRNAAASCSEFVSLIAILVRQAYLGAPLTVTTRTRSFEPG